MCLGILLITNLRYLLTILNSLITNITKTDLLTESTEPEKRHL